jgi:hypothetical protein
MEALSAHSQCFEALGRLGAGLVWATEAWCLRVSSALQVAAGIAG